MLFSHTKHRTNSNSVLALPGIFKWGKGGVGKEKKSMYEDVSEHCTALHYSAAVA